MAPVVSDGGQPPHLQHPTDYDRYDTTSAAEVTYSRPDRHADPADRGPYTDDAVEYDDANAMSGSSEYGDGYQAEFENEQRYQRQAVYSSGSRYDDSKREYCDNNRGFEAGENVQYTGRRSTNNNNDRALSTTESQGFNNNDQRFGGYSGDKGRYPDERGSFANDVEERFSDVGGGGAAPEVFSPHTTSPSTASPAPPTTTTTTGYNNYDQDSSPPLRHHQLV